MWSPAVLARTNKLVQWQPQFEYEPLTYGGRSVLKDFARIGTAREPRQQRVYLFDGTNDYAVSASQVTSGSNFTVSAIVIPVSVTGTTCIACEYGTNFRWIVANDTGKIRVQVYTAGSTNYRIDTDSVVLTNGTPAHVAVTLSGSTVAIYINGAIVPSTLISGTPAAISSSSEPLRLGSLGGTTWYYSGKMKDCRVYSVAKTAAEILAIDNQAATPTTIDTTGLLAHYACEEESGPIAYDSSGNGKHLTITNATLSTFHATDSTLPFSAANELGHSLALSCNGSNVYASNPSFATNISTGNWTISLKFTGIASGTQYIINRASSSFHISTQSGKLAVGTGTGWVETSAAVTDGEWTITHDTSQSSFARIKIYKNGVQQATANNSVWTDFSTASGVVEIGRRTTAATYTTAAITRVRWWTAIKTLAEVDANDAAGILFDVAPSNVGFVGLKDSSGNGYHFGVNGTQPFLVIPRSLSTPTQDVLGNTIHFTGQVPHFATVEPPCITGDGTATYADLGSALIPASADFSLSLYYKHISTNLSGIVSQGTLSEFRLQQDAGSHALGTTGSLQLSVAGVHNIALAGVLVAGTWYHITVSRVGSAVTLTTRNLSTGAVVVGTATDATAIAQTSNTEVLRRIASPVYSTGQVSDLQITTGGVTKTFPLQEGPGDSGTNRTLYGYASDGSAVSSGSLVNGTVSTIWGQRCPYAKDYAVANGSRVSSGVTIPANPATGLAADGNALNRAAGIFANDANRIHRINFNPYTAAGLNGTGAETALAGASARQATSPADSKFRRTRGSTTFQDDRYFIAGTRSGYTLTGLSGSDKTNAEAYVA